MSSEHAQSKWRTARSSFVPRELPLLSMTRGCGPANPAATQHNVTIVNDRSLSGRYCALRVVQSNMGTIIFQWRNSRRRSGMIISDLDRGFEDHQSLG